MLIGAPGLGCGDFLSGFANGFKNGTRCHSVSQQITVELTGEVAGGLVADGPGGTDKIGHTSLKKGFGEGRRQGRRTKIATRGQNTGLAGIGKHQLGCAVNTIQIVGSEEIASRKQKAGGLGLEHTMPGIMQDVKGQIVIDAKKHVESGGLRGADERSHQDSVGSAARVDSREQVLQELRFLVCAGKWMLLTRIGHEQYAKNAPDGRSRLRRRSQDGFELASESARQTEVGLIGWSFLPLRSPSARPPTPNKLARLHCCKSAQ